MGRLIYRPDQTFDIDDTLLVALRVVLMNKLRRREGFMLHLPAPRGGRSSLWVSPHVPVMLQFYARFPPRVDRALVAEMMQEASEPDGLTLFHEN